jgi:hypothetical protein
MNPAETASPVLVQCSQCAFWAHMNASFGLCHRHAPRPLSGSDTVAHWPQTYADEGCGDGVVGVEGAGIVRCASCSLWLGSDAGVDPVDLNDEPRSWWRRAGRCVRHAPLPLPDPGARMTWVATHARDGCAEGAKGRDLPPEANSP